jgi:hypothetical protein
MVFASVWAGDLLWRAHCWSPGAVPETAGHQGRATPGILPAGTRIAGEPKEKML